MDKGGQAMAPEKMIHKLQNQMERYRYVRKEAGDEFGIEKVKLSGKGGGENDDLYITFGMALTFGMVYLLDPRMRAQTQQNIGGAYMSVGITEAALSRPNADVERAKLDAAKEAAHNERYARKVTTRIQRVPTSPSRN
jgi:hypothetical protein